MSQNGMDTRPIRDPRPLGLVRLERTDFEPWIDELGRHVPGVKGYPRVLPVRKRLQ